MRIFFTGGSGKAGRHVVPYLLEQGHRITNADRVPLGLDGVHDLRVELTDAGRDDALFAGLPDSFEAFGGHKEAASQLPRHVIRLASSPACPVQAFRVGANVYATQFHPELDVEGICTRIDVYKDHGYFAPETAESLKADARQRDVRHPTVIMSRFAQRYARPT